MYVSYKLELLILFPPNYMVYYSSSHLKILHFIHQLAFLHPPPPLQYIDSSSPSAYLINRIPTILNGGFSPYEKFFGIRPNNSEHKVFRCACLVLLLKNEWTRLTTRSALCVFFGYGIDQNGYRCYDPIAKKLRISRHVASWSIFHFIVFLPPHLLFLKKMFLRTIPFLVQLLHLFRNSNTFQMREPSPFVFLSLLLCQRIFNLHLRWCKMKLPLCLIPLLSLKMSILHLHQLYTSIFLILAILPLG